VLVVLCHLWINQYACASFHPTNSLGGSSELAPSFHLGKKSLRKVRALLREASARRLEHGGQLGGAFACGALEGKVDLVRHSAALSRRHASRC